MGILWPEFKWDKTEYYRCRTSNMNDADEWFYRFESWPELGAPDFILLYADLACTLSPTMAVRLRCRRKARRGQYPFC